MLIVHVIAAKTPDIYAIPSTRKDLLEILKPFDGQSINLFSPQNFSETEKKLLSC